MANDTDETAREQAPDFRTIYVSGAFAIPSAFDFTINLSNTRWDHGTRRNIAVEVAALQMSPQHFKSLTALMVEMLAKYEVANGPLKVVEARQERIELLDAILASDLLAPIRKDAQAKLDMISSAAKPPEKPSRGGRKKKAH